MEAEQEIILASIGEELDVVCCSLAMNSEDKLQVFHFIRFLFPIKLCVEIFGHCVYVVHRNTSLINHCCTNETVVK